MENIEDDIRKSKLAKRVQEITARLQNKAMPILLKN